MQFNVPFPDTANLAAMTPILGAVMPVVSVLILLFLVAAIVLLFMRLQALGDQILELQREISRLASSQKKTSAVAEQSPAPTAPASIPPPPDKPVIAPIVQAPVETLTDAKLVAVITAAAVAYLGRRVAVRRITFINQNTVSGWAEAGRLSIHTSHNVRRN